MGTKPSHATNKKSAQYVSTTGKILTRLGRNRKLDSNEAIQDVPTLWTQSVKAVTCNQQEKYQICAGEHKTKNCDKIANEPQARFKRCDTKCANCGGEHPASYRGCPKYKTAQEITKIQATAPIRIFYAEAARRQRTTQLETAKISHNTRVDGTENVKLSNSEKNRAMPPSSDYKNITTVSNNVKPGINKQPSPSSESNEQNDQNEETHRNYVDKTFVSSIFIYLYRQWWRYHLQF